MTGRVRPPTEVQEALALRMGGWSVTAISERLAVPVSTLERWFSTNKVKKGSVTDEAIAQAAAELKASMMENVKAEIAAALADDVASFKAARSALNQTLEQLMADSSLPPHYRARGVVAIVTGMKLSSDLIHKSLNISGQEPEPETLPELVISELTGEEIEEMRQAQIAEAGANGSDIDFGVYDSEVVEESDDG